MIDPIEQNQTRNFFVENWKDLVGALSGFVAIIYGIGFLITSISLLSEYDIYDFSLIKARYVYVGAIFLMFLFICFWIAYFIYGNQNRILPEKVHKNPVVVIIYVVVASVLSSMIVGSSVKSLLIPLASFDRVGLAFTAIQMRIWMVSAILACYYVIWSVKSDFLKTNNSFPIPYSLFTAILFTIIFYAREVYPFMPFALGGGAPIAIKLVIDSERVDNLSEAVPSGLGNITSTLYLIDQSELSYFVLVPSKSTQEVVNPVEIKKDLVLGIVHQKDMGFPFPGNTESMPIVAPSPSSTSTP
ncbi:MAG: hypothetical protein H6666_09615 [Ardenticatenaceae bacterium]|nr:hypothetical protein [Ardenticatenaceae bacterium]